MPGKWSPLYERCDADGKEKQRGGNGGEQSFRQKDNWEVEKYA